MTVSGSRFEIRFKKKFLGCNSFALATSDTVRCV